MSRAPAPLPAELATRPFSLRQARELGVQRGRTRSGDLQVITSGVRVPAGNHDMRTHLAAFALALPPDVALSHISAARLHRLPTPRSWPGPQEPVEVMRTRARPRIERSGCRSHRGLESRRVEVVDGLRVTSAVDTWCDLATRWDPPDLLATADVLLRRGHADLDGLIAAAAARTGRRRAGALRLVAPLARAGSASPGESHVRWWIHVWGLPEPELNATILDRHGGWLAVGDLVWRARRVVGEYDGDHHRTDRGTWLTDRERRAALEDEGWRYVTLTSRTLSHPGHREALRRRLWGLLG